MEVLLNVPAAPWQTRALFLSGEETWLTASDISRLRPVTKWNKASNFYTENMLRILYLFDNPIRLSTLPSRTKSRLSSRLPRTPLRSRNSPKTSPLVDALEPSLFCSSIPSTLPVPNSPTTPKVLIYFKKKFIDSLKLKLKKTPYTLI